MVLRRLDVNRISITSTWLWFARLPSLLPHTTPSELVRIHLAFLLKASLGKDRATPRQKCIGPHALRFASLHTSGTSTVPSATLDFVVQVDLFPEADEVCMEARD